MNDFQFRMTKMTLIYFKINDFYSIMSVQEIYTQCRANVRLKDFVNINLNSRKIKRKKEKIYC